MAIGLCVRVLHVCYFFLREGCSLTIQSCTQLFNVKYASTRMFFLLSWPAEGGTMEPAEGSACVGLSSFLKAAADRVPECDHLDRKTL